MWPDQVQPHWVEVQVLNDGAVQLQYDLPGVHFGVSTCEY